MFFTQFMAWLNAQLQLYVSTQAVRAGSALAPAASALAAIYVMGWGFLSLTGRIEEPLVEGVRRVVTLGIVLGVALHLWLYNDVIVSLVVQGPRDLAAALLGAPDPIALLDTIWTKGGTCADTLWNRGGVFSGDVGFFIAGCAVWVVVAVLCLYCAFLIALSQIAAAILLAIGPLFLLAFLFERTRQLFDSWLSQLLNYSLVGLLVAMVAGLMLQFIVSYADQTAALGANLATVDVLDLLLATGLVFLLLRQILPIAAGLSRGVSLSTMGTFGGAVRRTGSAALAGATLVRMAAAGDDTGFEDSEPAAPAHIVPAAQPRVRPAWRRGES